MEDGYGKRMDAVVVTGGDRSTPRWRIEEAEVEVRKPYDDVSSVGAVVACPARIWCHDVLELREGRRVGIEVFVY